MSNDDTATGKRELIEPHKGDKRYVRRDEDGKFSESDDVGRSLSADRRRNSGTDVEPGQGDKGRPAVMTASRKRAPKVGKAQGLVEPMRCLSVPALREG